MGIYDREYYRSEEPGYHVSIASWSWTTKIIVITAIVYVIQLATEPRGWFTDTFKLHADWWTHPWMAYQLLTYGFLHSRDTLTHILFNMLLFWFLGRELEARYGPKEFIAFYLACIIAGGLAWSAAHSLWGRPQATAYGASAGCAGVLVLFAFNFPRRELLLWFVIPVPAWLVALLFVGLDIYGATTHPDHVGYEAHLGGALFALLYYQLHLRLSGFLPGSRAMPSFKRRPKLRVHRPEPQDDGGLESQVDDILRKIQESGMESLTRKERQILEKAGQEYKRRKQ
jgi:membrane associated rhomboid family serine protease